MSFSKSGVTQSGTYRRDLQWSHCVPPFYPKPCADAQDGAGLLCLLMLPFLTKQSKLYIPVLQCEDMYFIFLQYFIGKCFCRSPSVGPDYFYCYKFLLELYSFRRHFTLFNPIALNGLLYHNTLDRSISNSRVSGQFLLLLYFIEIPVFNAQCRP